MVGDEKQLGQLVLSPRRPHHLYRRERHLVVSSPSLQAPAPATSERTGGTAKT